MYNHNNHYSSPDYNGYGAPPPNVPQYGQPMTNTAPYPTYGSPQPQPQPYGGGSPQQQLPTYGGSINSPQPAAYNPNGTLGNSYNGANSLNNTTYGGGTTATNFNASYNANPTTYGATYTVGGGGQPPLPHASSYSPHSGNNSHTNTTQYNAAPAATPGYNPQDGSYNYTANNTTPAHLHQTPPPTVSPTSPSGVAVVGVDNTNAEEVVYGSNPMAGSTNNGPTINGGTPQQASPPHPNPNPTNRPQSATASLNNTTTVALDATNSSVPVVAAHEVVTDAMRRERAKLHYAPALKERLAKLQIPLPSATAKLLEADGINDAQDNNNNGEDNDDATAELGGVQGKAAGSHNNAQRGNAADIDLFDGVRLERYHVMFNMCDSVYKVGRKEFGPGIMYYFEFVKFLGLLTVILAAFEVAVWAKFVDTADPSPSFDSRDSETNGELNFLSDFMITSYNSQVRNAWFGVSITSIVLTFLAAPVYFLLMACFAKEPEDDDEITASKSAIVDAGMAKESKRERIVRYNNDTCDIDVSCHYRSRGNVIIRRVLAVVFLLVILGVQVVVSYFLTANQERASFGVAFAISIISTTIAAIFKFLSPYVTEFMMLESFDWWKRVHATSILLIRIGSLIAVFAAKDYAESANANCTYDIIGQQIVSMILVEIFVSPLMEVTSAVIWRMNAQRIAMWMESRLGDQDNLYPWDLADYYRNIMYRHFLTLMGVIVIPMIAVVSCLGYLLQFWIDKFLLYKMCGRPKRVAGTQKLFLTVMLAIVAICALLCPYAGTMFMLSGITRDKSPLCTFP